MSSKMQEVQNGQAANDLTVVVIRDGVAKELKNLPRNVENALEDAYDQEPISGISRESYMSIYEMVIGRIKDYRDVLAETGNLGEFSKVVAFAEAFDINSDESPLLVDLLGMISSFQKAYPESFNTHAITTRNMLRLLEAANRRKYNYSAINRDFKKWSRALFDNCPIRVGVIRFCKMYYSISKAVLVQAQA